MTEQKNRKTETENMKTFIRGTDNDNNRTDEGLKDNMRG